MVRYGIWHAAENKRTSVLNLPKESQVCPSLFLRFNVLISVVYDTLNMSLKRVVSVVSPLASNSSRGSHMISPLQYQFFLGGGGDLIAQNNI